MSSVGEDMEQLDPHTLLVGTQLWKTVLQFLKELNIYPPYNLVIPIVGIYTKSRKMCSYKDLYTKSIEDLLVILKTGNNSHVHQQVITYVYMYIYVYICVYVMYSINGILFSN